MIFENKRKIEVREVEVGDIIICNEQLYIITYDYANKYYGYVNLNTGQQVSGLDDIPSVMSHFKNMDARYFPNDSFTLTLE